MSSKTFLNEKETQALDKILDMLMPSSISGTQAGFLNLFYNKEAVKKALIEGAAKDPLMSIKIRNIFTILKQIFQD